MAVRDRELADLENELVNLRRGTEDGHDEAARLAEALSVRDAELADLRDTVERLDQKSPSTPAPWRRVTRSCPRAPPSSRRRRAADHARVRAGRAARCRCRGDAAVAGLSDLVAARDAQLVELESELTALRHGAEDGHEEVARLADELRAREFELAQLQGVSPRRAPRSPVSPIWCQPAMRSWPSSRTS